MDLIVISSPVTIVDESSIINHLFQSGLKYFHIRKPDSNIKAVKELINGIAPCFFERVALHQFHEIADEFGIKRLHYTEQARMQAGIQQWQMQVDAGFILSTSVHDTAIIPSLKHFDYVFYGPVFNSISKPGYQSMLPVDFKLGNNTGKPKVIAIGGVQESNFRKVKIMGFDGAAVLGTIWNEPAKAVDSFMKLKENTLFNIKQ